MKQSLHAHLLACAALLFGCSATAFAQDSGDAPEPVYYLKLVHADASVVTVPFSEKPVITQENKTLYLESESTRLEYEHGALDHFTITTTPAQSGADQLKPSVSTLKAVLYAGSVAISNGKPGAAVRVVTADGLTVASATLDAEGCASIQFPAAKGSVYFINTENTTFKFIRK